MRRANNQDSLVVMVAKSLERFTRRGHLFVVADGMGAHAAGELASQIASERISMQYYGSSIDDPDLAVVDAVHTANAAIFDRGRSNPEFHNMGTTASTLVMVPGAAYIAHVGDSRVYRLRHHTLEQLTFDHSLVWEMQASGQVPKDSALGRSIPRNVITRSLGPAPDVLVDLEGPFDLQLGDRYLLCSDGLTGQVTDEELAVLMRCIDLEPLVQLLIDLANLLGGPDNTTVIAVEVDGQDLVGDSGRSPAPRTSATSTSSWALLATMATCWLGAIGFGLVAALGQRQFTGSAIVAFVLGSIAAIVWATGGLQPKKRAARSRKRHTTHPDSSTGSPETKAREHAHGTAPYRSFDAHPNVQVYDRLGGLIEELRRTAEKKHWMLDWKEVDGLQQRAEAAKTGDDLRHAVTFQGDAFLAAMRQLKQHQDDSASDTAVDL